MAVQNPSRFDENHLKSRDDLMRDAGKAASSSMYYIENITNNIILDSTSNNLQSDVHFMDSQLLKSSQRIK